MFVISVKSSKKKILFIICIVLLFAVSFIAFGILRSGETAKTASCEKGEYSLLAGNNSQRLEFFGQFGWKTSDEPVSSKKVTIPKVFNEVYENYNQIQLSQGLDLSDYKALEVESYTYRVMNYPENKNVFINILVYDGVVIGGDVCSGDLRGFMCGFFKE